MLCLTECADVPTGLLQITFDEAADKTTAGMDLSAAAGRRGLTGLLAFN